MQVVDYKPENCQEAFNYIVKWSTNYEADLTDAYMATTRLTRLCKVAVENDIIYAIFMPDYHDYYQDVVKFHVVITPNGMRRWRDQEFCLLTYCNFLFSLSFTRKVVVEIPSFARLSQNIVERCGFKQEGIFIKEWVIKNKYYDIIRYSLLREEFKNG